ncbi:MAG: STAS domain-containing protein [Actinomycetota bacterium]
MEIGLESRVQDDWTVLVVKGEVDIYTAPNFRAELIRLIDQGANRLVLDLLGVDFMDSTGLSVLLSGKKRTNEANGDLKLVCTDGAVRKILTVTGLDKIFSLYPSVETAISKV